MRGNRQNLRLAILRAFAALPLSPMPPARGAEGQSQRILLIRPDHIGDLLFATPALRMLRRACPDAHLTAMVGPWGKPVIQDNPNLDEILICEFPAFSRKPKTSFLAPYRLAQQWAKQLRSQHFDMAIVLRFDHWWGALLACLARIPQRIGYALPECEPFLSQAIRYESHRHEVQQNLTLVEAAIATVSNVPLGTLETTASRVVGGIASLHQLGEVATASLHQSGEVATASLHQSGEVATASLHQSGEAAVHPMSRDLPADPPLLEFPIREQDHEYIAPYLARRGVPPPTSGQEPLVAIHPGAGAPVKQWLPEAWAQVGDALAASYAARIIITGSRDELDLAWSVSARMRSDAIVAAGDTSLAQLAALFQRCRLVIGPDCGPLHLAVAVGTPTVHLYGPVDTTKFGPWAAQDKHLVVTSGRACIPCNRLDYSAPELPDHPCIRDIAPESVLEAARKVLAQGG